MNRSSFFRLSAPLAVAVLRNMAAVSMLCAAVFAPIGPSYGQGAVNATVVAKVDGVEILARDLQYAEEVFGPSVRGMDEKARHDFLVNYAADVLIMSKAAQKQNVAIDEADLQRFFVFLRNKALMDKLLKDTAAAASTDEIIRKTYDDAVKNVTLEPEIRMPSMLFKVDDMNDGKAAKAAEAKAEEAIKRIKKGEAFVAVADAMTGDASKQSSRDFTYQTRQQMGGEIAQVAFALEVGAVSAPIKTELGWFVIKVEDKKMRKPPEFETVRDKFGAVAAHRAQAALMDKLRSEAKIERLDEVGQAATGPSK
jgi:peptidyl-prolyl cis-trans isomerase C